MFKSNNFFPYFPILYWDLKDNKYFISDPAERYICTYIISFPLYRFFNVPGNPHPPLNFISCYNTACVCFFLPTYNNIIVTAPLKKWTFKRNHSNPSCVILTLHSLQISFCSRFKIIWIVNTFTFSNKISKAEFSHTRRGASHAPLLTLLNNFSLIFWKKYPSEKKTRA